MMHTLLEKLRAWHKFVTFNILYNFHTKQAYLFHNWSIYYKLMLLLTLNTKLITVKLLARSYFVSTQFSYHSNTCKSPLLTSCWDCEEENVSYNKNRILPWMSNFPVLIQFKLKPYKDSYVLGCNKLHGHNQAVWSLNLKIKAGL